MRAPRVAITAALALTVGLSGLAANAQSRSPVVERFGAAPGGRTGEFWTRCNFQAAPPVPVTPIVVGGDHIPLRDGTGVGGRGSFEYRGGGPPSGCATVSPQVSIPSIRPRRATTESETQTEAGQQAGAQSQTAPENAAPAAPAPAGGYVTYGPGY
jgi:hypothetical protein